MYINTTTQQYPVSLYEIRQTHPEVSIPEGAGTEAVSDLGYAKVQPIAAPTAGAKQSVVEAAPIQVNGIWTQQWSVVDWTPWQLAQAKASKWEQIKAERDRRKAGGVLVSGKWFHTDADSRIQQIGLVMMGANVPQVQWKTMDGTFVTMTQALAGEIFLAVAALDQAAFSVAEQHRVAMEAAADPSTYDFGANWPAVYTA